MTSRPNDMQSVKTKHSNSDRVFELGKNSAILQGMRKSMGQTNFIKRFLTVAFILGQVRHVVDGRFFTRRNAGLGSLAARQAMCLFRPSIYSSESDSCETSTTKKPDSCGPTNEQQRKNQQEFIPPTLQTKTHQNPGFDGKSKVSHGTVESTKSVTNQAFPCKCCCSCSLREKPRDL